MRLAGVHCALTQYIALYNRDAPPNGWHIYKSNVASTLSRDLVDYGVTARMADELLYWLRDTDMPDEHYWSTIVANVDNGRRFGVVVRADGRGAIHACTHAERHKLCVTLRAMASTKARL